jgi:hypothetical protein
MILRAVYSGEYMKLSIEIISIKKSEKWIEMILDFFAINQAASEMLIFFLRLG